MADAIFSFLVFFVSLLVKTSSASYPGLQIVQAEREIDLTSHIVRVYQTLKIENTGDAKNEVLLAFQPMQFDHIASVQLAVVVGTKRKRSYTPLEANPTEQAKAPNGTKYYSVSLLNPLANGETATLEILYILTQSLEPFPTEIMQSDSQLVY